MLQLEMTLRSKRGFYAHKHKKVPHVKAALDAIPKLLDSIPDHVDGVDMVDWTSIVIRLDREAS